MGVLSPPRPWWMTRGFNIWFNYSLLVFNFAFAMLNAYRSNVFLSLWHLICLAVNGVCLCYWLRAPHK